MPYDDVVKKIIKETNLSKEEVVKKIEEKVKELGGLITPEGAAHIIARELEINLYDTAQVQKPKPLKISELMPGMNNVKLTAMVKTIYEPKAFNRKDGTQGAVQNIVLIDKSGYCRLVLWDDQIPQFKEFSLNTGDILRISGGYVKENKYDGIKELSLSSRSQIKINPEDIEKNAFPEKLLDYDNINALELGKTDVKLIGKITAIRQISTFKRKDGSEGKVSSVEIADETGKIKITLWGKKAELVENLEKDEVIEIIGGYTKEGLNNNLEIHLGKNGSINKKNVQIEVPTKILKSESRIQQFSKKTEQPQQEVRLSDLNEKMSNISLIARVAGKRSIKEFQRKDGTTSKVGNLLVKDNSGSGRITFWGEDTNYIDKVEIGDVIRIEGAYVRPGFQGKPEVHIGRSTEIDINPPDYLKEAIPALDLNFTKIEELKPQERDVNVKALITRVQEIRTFAKNNDQEGYVLNIGISDPTGSTRLVAWNEKAIEYENIQEMTPIKILHGYTKQGNQGIEIHLGAYSSIIELENPEEVGFEDLNEIETSLVDSGPQRVEMVKLQDGGVYEIRGTILKVYESKLYYHSCPECRKKVVEQEDGAWLCEKHGTVEPEITLYLSLALDDGTGCVRTTFFGENAQELIGIKPETIVDEITQIGIQSVIVKLNQRLKGQELVVTGRSRRNQYDDGMDLIVYSFHKADPEEEIKKIKKQLQI